MRKLLLGSVLNLGGLLLVSVVLAVLLVEVLNQGRALQGLSLGRGLVLGSGLLGGQVVGAALVELRLVHKIVLWKCGLV